MKKLLLCTLTSALFFATISAQDDSKIQESVEKLHAVVAQVEDQLKHINEKLNVLQSGSETTTSKLTETLTQLSQLQMHLTQPKTDQITTTPFALSEQKHDISPTPAPLPEPTPIEQAPSMPEVTTPPSTENSTEIEPMIENQTSEQPIEQPHEPTLLADIGTEQNMQSEQPQETPTDSGIVNTEATIL